jgi:hypothetical protein
MILWICACVVYAYVDERLYRQNLFKASALNIGLNELSERWQLI